MNMSKDYVFSINWEDRFKNVHKIGVLAQIEEAFYIIIREKEKAKEAFKNGYNGLPGFRTEKIYKSNEMFDFFKDRVLRKANIDYCEELSKTGGKSMIDSFFVERLSEEETEDKKMKILKAYELQEKLKMEENIKE